MSQVMEWESESGESFCIGIHDGKVQMMFEDVNGYKVMYLTKEDANEVAAGLMSAAKGIE